MSDRHVSLARRALVVLALCAWAGPARAADPERDSFEADSGVAAEVPAQVDEARDELKDDLGTQGLLTVDDATGAVRFLAKLDGFLDSTPSADAAGAAREYLADQAEVFGVERSDVGALQATEQAASDRMQSVEFTQTVEGVPIIDSSLQAHLDDEGRLLAITGGLLPDPTLETSDPAVTREEALDAAAEGVADAGAGYDGTLVAYTAGDELRLAWRVLVNASSTGHYDTLVDAATGEVVRRTNLVKFAGAATLFDNFPGDELGGTAGPQDLLPYLAPSPTRLIGPNAHAFVDSDDVVPGPGFDVFAPPSGQETPPSSGTDFVYPFDEELTSDYDCGPAFRCGWDPKTPLSWEADGDQAATQLFYYVNRFHDHLESPGIEFTTDNFEGADRVVAQAQDGADRQDVDGDTAGFPGSLHVNNANMLTLPAGSTPGALMQMYLWDPIRDPNEDLDEEPNYRPVHGGDDPSLVFHEYTHGLTSRLVTDAAGYGALSGAQAGAIDEGTADWYALDYLVGDGTTPYMPDDASHPDVTIARYEVEGPTGLRTQAIDCRVGDNDPACPDAGGNAGPGGYTYGDLAKIRGGAEAHDDGEIWAQTLWALRERLIEAYGSSLGITRARTLVTGALRLVPPDPSFLDMRNAILLADEQPGINGADRGLIWEVFADRGMGYAASTVDTDDVHPLQDFTPPPAPSSPDVGSVSGTVRDVNTGVPVANALVAFAGHDSGLGEDLSTRTSATGAYRIDRVPAPRVWSFLTVAEARGYDRTSVPNVVVARGAVATRNITLRRNWALGLGGTTVRSWSGPDFGDFGCGPESAIDGSRRGVWSTYGAGVGSVTPGPKELILALPGPITLGEVRIDPSSGCGDPAGSALAGYLVQASTDGTSFSTIAQGTFGPGNVGKTNAVPLTARPGGVRFVKLRALSSQGASAFMDVAELQVFGPLPSVAPPPPPRPPPPPPIPDPKLTFPTSRAKLSARRTFVWKLAGPRGAGAQAQFTVRVRSGRTVRRITLARARFGLSTSTGRARVVVRVSRRTLRRIPARTLKVTVTVRAAGQRRSDGFSLQRPRRR